MTCPECNGTRERIINPDWPSGTEPYSEKCPECSGMGEVEAPRDEHKKAKR